MKCACCFTIMFLILGTDAIFILSGFIGETIKLFPSASIGSHDNAVLIYVNGLSNNLIAKWTLKNCTGKLESIIPSYEEKLFMDTSRNIWIHDVNSSDEGIYIIYLGTEQEAPKFYLNLTVSERKITKEQIQKWLDDQPDFSKKYIDYGKAVFVNTIFLLAYVFCKVILCLWKEFARMKKEKKQLIPYILERLCHQLRRHEHAELITTPAHETVSDVKPGHGDQESVHQGEHAHLLEDQNEGLMGTTLPGETNSMMDIVAEIDYVNLEIERKRRNANAKLERYGRKLVPRKRNDTWVSIKPEFLFFLIPHLSVMHERGGENRKQKGL
ncbi:hypothetical protein CHS0354_024363 [Potamilus streckersoni]|uniref:Uncharacterized protein n=1 Tax=Potamilus streckersoni TaxID=2493646 RepID=A0AAE0SV22_9BIVA|nr:hypothetical protein CHS0354_024363 [Potamilus streckersoni]